MIPILYEANETKFKTNGIGRMSDAITCVVTEERNGQYELEMTYPVTGIHYDELEEERIILALPSDGATTQPFRIYAISRPLDGIVTVQAQHISYMLKKMIVLPFTASSAAGAMNEIQTRILGDNPFTFWTDKESTGTMNQKVPIACRSLLGGTQGSVLDAFGGGEYEFDRFDVKLHESRGADNGVTIRYGKNLTDLESDTDYSGTYTSAVAYWQKEDQVVVGDQVESDHVSDYSYQKCTVLDMSQNYETAPTKEQLNADAKTYMKNNAVWEPSANIDISFLPLWQSEEYAGTAPLQRVRLCDVVTVEYGRLGVSAKAKVIKTVYNTLTERYSEIGIGDARTSFADAVNSGNVSTEDMSRNMGWLQQAIERASELIRGGLGGHVVITTNADGQPEEILIMDTDDIETAQSVWRWNLGGLGYSSTGYHGDFGTAITMKGEIVADYVNTGKLTANLIKAGILSDKTGTSYWDMESGEMNLVVTKFSLSNGKTIEGIAQEAASAAQQAAESHADDAASAAQQAAQSYADSAAALAVAAQTQKDIFDKLTNGGKVQGIFLVDGRVYINAEFMDIEFLSAIVANMGTITAGQLKSTDYAYTSGNFASAGMIIDLTNRIIRTKEFAIVNGNAYFSGDLSAAGGTFSGNLEAAGGTFKGELKAAKGTFSGDLEAAGGTFSGDLQAAGGTFSGDLRAAGGTFSGNLSAAGGTFSGNLSAAGGTFSGDLSAAGGTFSGSVVSSGSTGICALRSGWIGFYNSGTSDYSQSSAQSYISSSSSINGNLLISNRRTITMSIGYSAMIGMSSGGVTLGNTQVNGSFSVTGTKNRRVKTANYGERLLYCYETASPMFGDIGEGTLDENGECVIAIDDIFTESANAAMRYVVFLQKEGEGDVWIAEKNSRYFTVKGTPGLAFAWEIKAKQIGYEYTRLDRYDPDDRLPDAEDIEFGYAEEAADYATVAERLEEEYLETASQGTDELEGLLYEAA